EQKHDGDGDQATSRTTTDDTEVRWSKRRISTSSEHGPSKDNCEQMMSTVENEDREPTGVLLWRMPTERREEPLIATDSVSDSLLAAVRLGFPFLFGEKEGDKRNWRKGSRVGRRGFCASHVPLIATVAHFLWLVVVRLRFFGEEEGDGRIGERVGSCGFTCAFFLFSLNVKRHCFTRIGRILIRSDQPVFGQFSSLNSIFRLTQLYKINQIV
ncbi:hypothetical protein HN51_043924, partial [Arachis hypogaea]